MALNEAPRLFGIVDAVDDEQDHRVLEQVVVERAQQLRDEQRQEAARRTRCVDVVMRPCRPCSCCGPYKCRNGGTTTCGGLFPGTLGGYACTRMLTLPNPDAFAHCRGAAAGLPAVVAGWELGLCPCLRALLPDGHHRLFRRLSCALQRAVSKLGVFLDPIADKIMVAAVILVLTAQGVLRGPYVGDMHVIAGLIILMREIAVSGLREFLGGLQVSVPVSRLAKWKTTFQIVCARRADPGPGAAMVER
jgi:cardiolipin synthase (CMP-forming)